MSNGPTFTMPRPDPNTQYKCTKCGQIFSTAMMGTHKHTAQEWIDYQASSGAPAGYPLWTTTGVTPVPPERPPYPVIS